MIAIVNIDDNPRASGTHKYEIRINRTPVAQFEHNREAPLSLCLKRAYNAVIAWESEEMRKWLNVMEARENGD